MNEREIGDLLFEYGNRIRELEAELQLLRVKGLNDLVSGTGNQRFGGVMQLGKYGTQVLAPSASAPIPSLWFRSALNAADPSLDTDVAYVAGYVESETGIKLVAKQGSLEASVGAFANDTSGEAVVYVQQALLLYSLGADPSFLVDGMIWYRSDTDTYHVRANGLTKTITIT